MREDFLHYLWRQARFDLRNLTSTTGASISIQNFGHHNKDAGPDFSGGQLRINGLQWAGNIEMHVRASEWYDHGHDSDPAYDNVILHVVLDEDRPVFRRNGERIPCLALRGRIPQGLLNSYWRLMHNEAWVPCQRQIHLVDEPARQQCLDELLHERILLRSRGFADRLERTGKDWEEAFYQSLARAMGGRVNADAMDMLARSIPLRVLLKHKHSLLQLEALLFGQSALIPKSSEGEATYIALLRREYALLRTKHNLRPLPVTAWRYLRLRPNNFPTIRIAQLAAMLYRTGQLFGKALAAADAKEMTNMFEVELSNYWRTHFRFGKEGRPGRRRLGTTTIHSILINTIAPALVAYGEHRSDDRFQKRAQELLQNLPAEENSIVRQWNRIGIPARHAADSQALLQLKKQYCEKTRCTDCRIGCQLLKQQYYANEDDGPLLTINEQAQVYARFVG